MTSSSVLMWARMWVERRTKEFPMALITKDVFGTLGAVGGGIVGFSESLRMRNGILWRPTLGATVGGCAGFFMGLFPYHTFGLAVAADIAYTCLDVNREK